MASFGLLERAKSNSRLRITEPLDYFAFQKLTSDCSFVITDSGGIQEETTFRRIPCLTLRPNTERPSTVVIGTNELVPFDIDIIQKKINAIISGTYKKGNIPPLWDGKSTERILAICSKLMLQPEMSRS
jgi:UDP-N-acetylglucosamine 2-epimerase (non-hydrolysing)